MLTVFNLSTNLLLGVCQDQKMGFELTNTVGVMIGTFIFLSKRKCLWNKAGSLFPRNTVVPSFLIKPLDSLQKWFPFIVVIIIYSFKK